MPYARNSDLPATVRDALPDAAQTRFRQVVNDALDRDLSDSQSFASAWSVVRQGWKKDGDKWVRIKKLSKPLFLSRKLENAGDVIDWAKAQGFETTLQPGDMHATIAYSHDKVKWPTPAIDSVTVHGPEGRSLKQFGDATVLAFDSPTLASRWKELLAAGASWDHDEFNPHVTLTWAKNGVDPTTIELYTGPLIFGPEVMHEIDPNFSPDQVVEKVMQLPVDGEAVAVYAMVVGGGGTELVYVTKRDDGSYHADAGDFDFARATADAMHKHLVRRKAEFVYWTRKFNPNHDELGRFASGPGGGGGNEGAGVTTAAPSPSNFTVTSGGDLTGYTPQPANSASELFQRTYNPSITADQVVELAGAGTRVAEAEALIAASGGVDTKTKNSDSNGVYTAERQALHETMLDEVFTAEAVGAASLANGQPTFYVLGGRGGAGKSWFSKSPDSPFDESSTLNINTDTFKERLPEYEGWNAALVHEESSDIAERAHTLARDSKLNVTFDATLKSPGTITRLVNEYKAAGYRVEGYFMHTAPQVSAVRAVNRFNKPNPGQPLSAANRYVPPAYILSSTGNEKVFDSLVPQFAKYAIYDNNTGGGPKLIKSG